MSGMMNHEQQQSTGNTPGPLTPLFKLIGLLAVVGAGLLGLRSCLAAARQAVRDVGHVAGKTSKALTNTFDRTLELLGKHLGSKDAFAATFGPIVADQRFRRLQFCQRNQVCMFRIVRYRGRTRKACDYTQAYKTEADKREPAALPILLGQYCEWEAKGVYEFNFYVDMSDLSKWNHTWDPGRFTLTLYPPAIEANTPAETEAPVYRCLADSITIDQDYTKEQLAKEMPSLKLKLAEDQKQFFYNEARIAVAEHYRQFLKLIPGLELDRLPEIKVVFPHEQEIDRKKL